MPNAKFLIQCPNYGMNSVADAILHMQSCRQVNLSLEAESLKALAD